MKKLVTSDNQQALKDNQHETFLLGAPFLAYLRGEGWNEDTSIYQGRTTKLQSVVWDEDLQKWTLKCLCEFGFTDTPMNLIQAGLLAKIPEEGEPSDYLTDLELVLLSRMEGLSEEHLELSVVAYCDDVLTAPFFEIVDV